VDEKKGLQDEPQAQDGDDSEDTEGNMHPRGLGEKQPTSGGENPTGRDDQDAGSEGEGFHPRPY
jgi:hypothetical protein